MSGSRPLTPQAPGGLPCSQAQGPARWSDPLVSVRGRFGSRCVRPPLPEGPGAPAPGTARPRVPAPGTAHRPRHHHQHWEERLGALGIKTCRDSCSSSSLNSKRRQKGHGVASFLSWEGWEQGHSQVPADTAPCPLHPGLRTLSCETFVTPTHSAWQLPEPCGSM